MLVTAALPDEQIALEAVHLVDFPRKMRPTDSTRQTRTTPS